MDINKRKMRNKKILIDILLFIVFGILFGFGAHLLGFKHEDNSSYTLKDNLILGFIGSSAVIFVPLIRRLLKH